MRWELTYLGTQIAVATATPEAYGILTRHGLTSWQQGGCSVLAAALARVLRADQCALVRDDGTVDHVVVWYEGVYLDADGAFTGVGIRAKHKALEGSAVRIVGLGGATVAGVLCPISAVTDVAKLLSDFGVGSSR